MGAKPYILRAWPEMIDTTTPENLERLRRFIDYQLSINGEMSKALQAEMGGKHHGAMETDETTREGI